MHLYRNDHENSMNSKNVDGQIRLPSMDERNNQHILEDAMVVRFFKNKNFKFQLSYRS